MILDIEPGKEKTTHVSDFCQCGHCSLMETELENICCKSKRICVKMPDDICITAHHDFDTIINKGSYRTIVYAKERGPYLEKGIKYFLKGLCHKNYYLAILCGFEQ